MTSKFGGLVLSSTYLAFDFRDDLDEEEDLGEEVDLFFFRLCFFGMLGRSVGGMSLNVSDTGCWSIDSKSVTKKRKEKQRKIYDMRSMNKVVKCTVNWND